MGREFGQRRVAKSCGECFQSKGKIVLFVKGKMERGERGWRRWEKGRMGGLIKKGSGRKNIFILRTGKTIGWTTAKHQYNSRAGLTRMK